MNVLTILAHPRPGSFVHALADSFRSGVTSMQHNMDCLDLYQEGYSPVLTHEELGAIYSGQPPQEISHHQDRIQKADVLAFFYPVWWYDQPAILKGWLDRTLQPDFAFSFSKDKTPEGLLTQKQAIVILTTGESEDRLKQEQLDRLPLQTMAASLRFCGLKKIHTEIFFAVSQVSPETRESMLAQTQQLGASIAPI